MRDTIDHHELEASLPEVRTLLRGRDAASASLRAMLTDPDTRLVTITGPGGVGKTRLAVQAAHDLVEEFGGQVAFVSLASIRHASLVPLAIGQAFGMSADRQEGQDERVLAMLRDRRALVVLDNLEQIPDVAPLVQRLLASCPSLTLLATSQVLLHVAGEHAFPLAPLDLPDAAAEPAPDLAEAAPVALFLDRAREIVPLYQPDGDEIGAIASLCARLDGLPLAIELAAARIHVVSPQTMLERVDDRLRTLGQHRGEVPDRLRTLRAAIAWSHDLLDPGAQRLLQALSVFEGGISPAGAAAVCDCGAADEVLATLVDHNLLQEETLPHGEVRYLMLESIRAFGIDRLRAEGRDDATRDAHARFVAGFAEEAAVGLSGPGQVQWAARIDAEFANIRAAVEWAGASDAAGVLLRIVAALAGHMRRRGYTAEARSWLADALRRPDPASLTQRIDALIVAGLIEHDHGVDEVASAYLSQAHDLALAVGDRPREGRVLMGLGVVAATRRQSLEASADLLRRAATLLPEDEFPVDHATVLLNLGDVAFYLGEPDTAMAHLAKARRLAVGAGDRSLAAHIVINMGIIATDVGRYDDAVRALEEGAAWSRELRMNRLLSGALGSLAEVALANDDVDTAEDLFREALGIHRLDGLDSRKGEALIGLSLVASERRDWHRSATLLLDALQLIEHTMNLPFLVEPDDQALNLLAGAGEMANAARVLGFIHADLARSGGGMSVFNQRMFQRAEGAVRAQLAPEAVAALMEEGARIPEDRLNRELQRMVRQVVGRRQPEPAVRPRTMDVACAPDPFGLTSRELDVLRLLAAGKPTGEIAASLGVSPRTVGTHISNLMGKMGVSSRTAAVALAAREGVVSLDGTPENSTHG